MKHRSVGVRTGKRREVESLARDVVRRRNDYYIRASSLTSRRATRVLVNGESFAVFEVGGDIVQTPLEPLGFFHHDTRFLSRFELRIAGEPPYYLNSYSSSENAQLRINLSNPDLDVGSAGVELPRNSIQIERNWVIAGAALFHKLIARNFSRSTVELPLDFLFAVDFADLFEVRGFRRGRRRRHLAVETGDGTMTYRYRGRDRVERFTRITFAPTPEVLQDGRASLRLVLEPDEQRELEVRILGGSDSEGGRNQTPARFDDALAQRRVEIARFEGGWATITASHAPLNSLLERSAADLTSMIRLTPEGTFLMAGIPWFATLFGRDSILTALFVLPFNPALAVGTLKSLASLQGTALNRRRDEEPGKIVHEIRAGELAAIGAVPFGRYFGSVDSTPLFLWLLGSYVETTGDLSLAEQLWPHAEAALEWIERWGDRDGDLYVEYFCETPRGLANQGWKDSFDAISHADGTLARPPIALCEVQGYVYAAYLSMALLARRLGREEPAARLSQRAAALRARFSREFWLDKEKTVALGLDADKQPCRVMASNAGHCLAAGLLNREQAEALAERLLSEEMFSGWGIRTLACDERRYNPMSYHNGSVWPHDNAIVAAGLGRFGKRREVLRILDGLLEAAAQLKSGSLPELFCGYPRDERLGPVPYPVACHPQAWSAASIFMILQAMLGLEVNGVEGKLIVNAPMLPEWLDWLRIENLRVGDGAVSLIIRRIAEGASIGVLERHGNARVEILK